MIPATNYDLTRVKIKKTGTLKITKNSIVKILTIQKTPTNVYYIAQSIPKGYNSYTNQCRKLTVVKGQGKLGVYINNPNKKFVFKNEPIHYKIMVLGSAKIYGTKYGKKVNELKTTVTLLL